ncbi:MAG: hypothetical protein ACREBY_07330 [Polaromonas sp.]
MPLRQQGWNKIARKSRPAHLARIAHVIGMDELPTYLDRTLDGQVRGRTVIDMSK